MRLKIFQNVIKSGVYSCNRIKQNRNFNFYVIHRNNYSISTGVPCKPDETDDIVIVGGGIVGTIVACKLKMNPLTKYLKLRMIDSSAPPELDIATLTNCPDSRVYTITPASKLVLEEIDVWDTIPKKYIKPFDKMQIWDSMGNAHVRFNCMSTGNITNKINYKDKSLAYVIENNILQYYLHNKLKELISTSDNHLFVHFKSKVKNFQIRTNEPNQLSSLTIENSSSESSTIYSKIIIAADGGKSMIREAAGMGTWGWDYNQKAIVATIKMENRNDNMTAYQRFFPTGPLAVLPIRNGFHSVVWSTSIMDAKKLLEMDNNNFIHSLNDSLHKPSKLNDENHINNFINSTLHTLLAAVTLSSHDPFQTPSKVTEIIGKKFSFPLKMQHALKYTLPGIYLVGDSAHTIHPLAGQGLNLGIADANALVNTLLYGLKHGINLDNSILMEKYETGRKNKNIAMALLMDGLKKIFGCNYDSISILRSTGMGTLNVVEPLKLQIMRFAMGI